MKRATVLIVEYGTERREQMAEWLDAAGYEVEACPGPTGPDYTCLGGRGGVCPLAAAADVIVLDDQLASDAVMQGTPAWQLLTHYVELGTPVVVLGAASDFVAPLEDDTVKVIRRPVDCRSLLDAVAELSGAAR